MNARSAAETNGSRRSSARTRSLASPAALGAALGTWCVIELTVMAASAANGVAAAWSDIEAATVILVAATLSSVAGFAFAALAGIGLAFVTEEPVRIVHTIVLCSIATQLYAVWQLRSQIRLGAIAPMLIGGALAVPFGTWLLLHVPASGYRLGLGVFLIAYGAFSIALSPKWNVRATRSRDAMVAALAGFVGGLTAFPGALMAIWCSLRGIDKTGQRAIYQPFILAMQIVTAVSLNLLGPAQIGGQRNLQFVAFAVAGAAIGFAWFRRLSPAQFRVALNTLLIVSGVGLSITAMVSRSH